MKLSRILLLLIPALLLGMISSCKTNSSRIKVAVGTLVREALPEGGTLAIFVGQTSPLNARQRFWGLVDELNGVKERKDFPDARFDGSIGGKYKIYRNVAITDNANRETAQVNAQ